MLKKGLIYGAGHGKTRYKENTIWLGMRRRDDVRNSKEFTIDFSEIQFIVSHNSQSDGQNKSAKSGTNLRQKTILINSEERRRYKGQVSCSKQSRKNGSMRLRFDYRAAVLMKNRLHHESN